MTFRSAMRSLTIACVLIAAPFSAMAVSSDRAEMPANTYVLEPSHASVIGKVSHFGLSMYRFRFDKFEATYVYDPAKPDAAQLSVSIDVNSLNTGTEKTNNEFARDFMGAEKSPVATFVSHSITYSANTAVVVGDLTLNGVTKVASLNVTFNGYGPLGPMGVLGTKAGFTASLVVKRSEFGLTKYLPSVGDDVSFDIDAEFVAK